MNERVGIALLGLAGVLTSFAADDFPKPYSPPSVERENIFEFTERPAVKTVGPDRYETAFAVKGNCDVTAAIVDEQGVVIRHLGSGVLGPNAPAPFQKNSLRQTLTWDGKDDLGAYVKDPSKLRVSVRLGLKPEFDKLLGVSHPKNIAGFIQGISLDETGAYVWMRGGGFSHVAIRKYDHDGNYVMSLTPPPSSLPESRLGGRTVLEYEPGKRSHHNPVITHDFTYEGSVLPAHNGLLDFTPAIAGNRIYFCSPGPGYFTGKEAAKLYYIHTDGSSDVEGSQGKQFLPYNLGGMHPRYAASPDGKWLYVARIGSAHLSENATPAVLRYALGGAKPAEHFVGKMPKPGKFEPGSDNESLNNPCAIDCDAQGRIYVSDGFNNRIQIFSPEGKHLKTVAVDRPREICVHRKTGALYLQHMGEVQGRSVTRFTKFKSFEDPTEEFHVDGIAAASMALDSTLARPRIWMGGGVNKANNIDDPFGDHSGSSVVIYEEDGKTLKKIVDFDAEMKALGGDNHIGRWSNDVFDHVNCDPVREQLYFRAWRGNSILFDLKTGRKVASHFIGGSFNDIAFDKKGYMHVHLDPGFGAPGIVRLDPSQSSTYKDMWGEKKGVLAYKEVPYDYGQELAPGGHPYLGVIPVKDQPGAKYFQDGMGVDMGGNIAEQCNIYYTPRFEEEGAALSEHSPDRQRYAEFLRVLQERQKRGEEVYSIRRLPGIPIAGATIWTFNSNGELRQECAAITGGTMAGVHTDEDGYLYFGTSHGKMIAGKVFLSGKGSNLGSDKVFNSANATPATYSFVKARPKDVRWILKKAPVPMEPPPSRPLDLTSWGPFGHPESQMWAEGVEWIYAGQSPGVPAGCTCPSTRPHLDWFKRSYVPEAYRYSIGILDTAGNLILHLGRYGNLDDVLKTKPGSQDVPLTMPRFLSATDNYLAFDDWGERLVVLKLNYHAEANAGIK